MQANTGIEPNACWNTLGSVIKMSEGPASGWMPTENAAGKMMNPESTEMQVPITHTLTAVCPSRVSRLK